MFSHKLVELLPLAAHICRRPLLEKHGGCQDDRVFSESFISRGSLLGVPGSNDDRDGAKRGNVVEECFD